MRGLAMLKRFITGSVSYAASLVASVSPSLADFRICNYTNSTADAAIGYKDPERGWMSKGWWVVRPEKCATVLTGDLRNRYYYVYARDEQGRRWQGGDGWEFGTFCINRAKAFTADQREYRHCDEYGLGTRLFRLVDTGKDKDYAFDMVTEGKRAQPREDNERRTDAVKPKDESSGRDSVQPRVGDADAKRGDTAKPRDDSSVEKGGDAAKSKQDNSGEKSRDAGKSEDGSSFAKAVYIDATNSSDCVDAEHAWLQKHYLGWRIDRQSLVENQGKHYDVIDLHGPNGESKTIYFNIGLSLLQID
jgi:uncharacterized membrane protein